MVRIVAVELLHDHVVTLRFGDGSEKSVDLRPYLQGPIFKPVVEDPALFREVGVDRQLGTIVWPNGADICPDVLYGNRLPASLEEASAGGEP